MRNLKLLPALTAIALVAAGCPEPVETQDPPPQKLSSQLVTTTANANVAAHLDGLARVLKVFEDSGLISDLTGSEEPVPPECPPGTQCLPDEPEPSIEEDAKELEQWLADNVFNEASVEASDETSVTYRLKSDYMCPEEVVDQAGTKQRDPDCVKLFNELPFRLIATVPAEGDLDLAGWIGTAHPVDFQLYASKVGATVDLAEIKAAVNAIATTLGEETPDFPATFAGKVELAIVKGAVADEYVGHVSVLADVNVVNKTSTDPEYLDLKVAAATDAVTLKLNGASKTALGGLAFKAIDLAMALDMWDPNYVEECHPSPNPGEPEWCEEVPGDPRQGVLAGHLAGITGQGELSVDKDELKVTGLGAGDGAATVKYNGTQILSFEMNAAAGHKLDLTVTDAEGGPIVKVKPSFVLDIAHKMSALQSEYDDIPAWLLDGQAKIKLDGAAEPSVQLLEGYEDHPTCAPDSPDCEPQPETAEKYIKVLAGVLTFEGTGVDTVTVQADSCLVEVLPDTSTDDTHPLETVESGSCVDPT